MIIFDNQFAKSSIESTRYSVSKLVLNVYKQIKNGNFSRHNMRMPEYLDDWMTALRYKKYQVYANNR